MTPEAAYVHVPFCVHRCGYCDFTVVARRDDLIGPYLDGLELEIRSVLKEPQFAHPAVGGSLPPHPGPLPHSEAIASRKTHRGGEGEIVNCTSAPRLNTLFIGGGTPTYLPAPVLARLLQLLATWLPLKDGGEYSVEANPADFDASKMEVLARHGVNRISLGVQSFQAEHLKTLERDHTPEVVASVVENLRKHGFQNISLDLIYGVPGQTLEEWTDTLNQAIALNPEHISAYGLTYEKGTSFWTRREKGAISPVHDELERSMYSEVMTRLPAHGYQQYELSNFAKPGFECLHNQVYWQAEPYFGFGPGAASYLEGTRRMNHRSVTTWLKRVRAGESPEMDREELSPELLAREAVMLGLRQIKGINLKEFQTRFGCTVESLAPDAWRRFLDAHLLEVLDNRVALTEEGRFLADSVVVEFI